jgi:hypothetical protein
VRLDKVVLAVEEKGERAQTELTPADSRELAGLLEKAAATAEQTPGS